MWFRLWSGWKEINFYHSTYNCFFNLSANQKGRGHTPNSQRVRSGLRTAATRKKKHWVQLEHSDRWFCFIFLTLDLLTADWNRSRLSPTVACLFFSNQPKHHSSTTVFAAASWDPLYSKGSPCEGPPHRRMLIQFSFQGRGQGSEH